MTRKPDDDSTAAPTHARDAGDSASIPTHVRVGDAGDSSAEIPTHVRLDAPHAGAAADDRSARPKPVVETPTGRALDALVDELPTLAKPIDVPEPPRPPPRGTDGLFDRPSGRPPTEATIGDRPSNRVIAADESHSIADRDPDTIPTHAAGGRVAPPKPSKPEPRPPIEIVDTSAGNEPSGVEVVPPLARKPASGRDARELLPEDEELPDGWDMMFAWIGKHGAPWAVGLLAIVVAFMYGGVFRGESIGDDLTFHMAEAARLSDCIRHGDWDFWNPSANGGYASAYYYQVIPQLASALPAALFGHLLFWFQLSLVLPLIITPIATYRGARMMGATPWQSVSAAIAVTYISGASRWGGGADGSFQVGLYTQTWALAFFPLGLGHGIRWMRDGKSLAPAIAWGALVYLCHPFAGISLCLALGFGLFVHLLMPLGRTYAGQLVALGFSTLAFALNAIYFATDRLKVEPEGGGPPEEKIRWLYLVPLFVLGALIVRLIVSIVRTPDKEPEEPVDWWSIGRIGVLAACLAFATMPGWITLLADADGFGGFPHRVPDEVGPGYKELMDWQVQGWILDFGRPMVLTWLIPLVVLLARGTKLLRWLWTPAVLFAALLAIGPHAPKTQADLFPAVRFLGALQVVLAMAVGMGLYAIAMWLWTARDGSARAIFAKWAFLVAIVLGGLGSLAYLWLGSDTSRAITMAYRLALRQITDPDSLRIFGTIACAGIFVGAYFARFGLATMFGVRTAISAVLAIVVVVVALPGAGALSSRVRALGDKDYSYRDELMRVNEKLTHLPQGNKQVGPGCENHWWNLLSYSYGRRPSLLQMGGGGLQASPNYDFVWSVRDFHKLAWVYNTPFFQFNKANQDQPEGETVAQTENIEIRRFRTDGWVAPIQITGVLPPGPNFGGPDGGSETRKAAIEWLKSDLPYKNHHLAYDGYGAPTSAPDATVIRSLYQDSPGDEADVLAEVDVRQPSTFVMRQSWHPRWHAYIDGVETKVLRVTPDFPAIEVPTGKHVLAFRFERPWWAQASWLMWPGVALLAFLATRPERRRRRKRPADARPT